MFRCPPLLLVFALEMGVSGLGAAMDDPLIGLFGRVERESRQSVRPGWDEDETCLRVLLQVTPVAEHWEPYRRALLLKAQKTLRGQGYIVRDSRELHVDDDLSILAIFSERDAHFHRVHLSITRTPTAWFVSYELRATR